MLMPIPKPTSGQSEQQYVSACMSWMHDNEPKRSREQQLAMCYNTYRQAKKGEDQTDILTRLNNVKDKLVQVFGAVGLKYYYATLDALGVTVTAKGDYLYKGDVFDLPFIKTDEDGSIEFNNMLLAEVKFSKIDKQNRTVSGYANTIVFDCDRDIVLPEAYAESIKEYIQFPVVYFNHQHREPAFGTFKRENQSIDEIGWFVKTNVAKNPPLYWEMVEDGRLNGYSIGGRFRAVPEEHGNARVWRVGVHVMDLSAVPRPCNKLSFWGLFKSKSEPESNFTFDEITHVHSYDPNFKHHHLDASSQLSDHSITCPTCPPSGTGINLNGQKSTPKGAKKERKLKKGDKKTMSEEEKLAQESEETSEEKVEPEETEKAKTPEEIYKEELQKATTPEEFEVAKEKFMRAKIFEEQRSKFLADAEKKMQEREQYEMNQLPKTVKTLEDKITELTATIEKQSNRLLKMEEMPDRSRLGGETKEDVQDPLEKVMIDAFHKYGGHSDLAWKMADKVKNEHLKREARA